MLIGVDAVTELGEEGVLDLPDPLARDAVVVAEDAQRDRLIGQRAAGQDVERSRVAPGDEAHQHVGPFGLGCRLVSPHVCEQARDVLVHIGRRGLRFRMKDARGRVPDRGGHDRYEDLGRRSNSDTPEVEDVIDGERLELCYRPNSDTREGGSRPGAQVKLLEVNDRPEQGRDSQERHAGGGFDEERGEPLKLLKVSRGGATDDVALAQRRGDVCKLEPREAIAPPPLNLVHHVPSHRPLVLPQASPRTSHRICRCQHSQLPSSDNSIQHVVHTWPDVGLSRSEASFGSKVESVSQLEPGRSPSGIWATLKSRYPGCRSNSGLSFPSRRFT